MSSFFPGPMADQQQPLSTASLALSDADRTLLTRLLGQPEKVFAAAPDFFSYIMSYLEVNPPQFVATKQVPVGSVLEYSGATAPTGFVLCDGTLYDGTTPTYGALWAVIGTTYGGTGQNSFAVPDMRGRVPVGLGTNASVNARGTSDGVAVGNRRPQHRHTGHTHANYVNGGASGVNDGFHAMDGTAGLSRITSAAVDGGSGTAADSLDAPAYLVINFIIAI